MYIQCLHFSILQCTCTRHVVLIVISNLIWLLFCVGFDLVVKQTSLFFEGSTQAMERYKEAQSEVCNVVMFDNLCYCTTF